MGMMRPKRPKYRSMKMQCYKRGRDFSDCAGRRDDICQGHTWGEDGLFDEDAASHTGVTWGVECTQNSTNSHQHQQRDEDIDAQNIGSVSDFSDCDIEKQYQQYYEFYASRQKSSFDEYNNSHEKMDSFSQDPSQLYWYPDMSQAIEGLKETQDCSSNTNKQCYVILFGTGSEETEGIYTLRTVDCGEDGETMNVDTVVAFENEVDAQRFATLLEASLKHQPAVYSTSWSDITEWCEENNARCRLEPSGSLLIPPESNVSVTDWERALALQRGEFTVLDYEPSYGEVSMESMEESILKEMRDLMALSSFEFQTNQTVDIDNISNIVDSKLAGQSIAEVREELEKLIRRC